MNAPHHAVDRFESEHRAYHNAADKSLRFEPSDEDREEALQDIAARLIAGKLVDGWSMADVIDCWINRTEGNEAAKELSQLLNVYADNGSAATLWLNVLDWQEKLVRKIYPADKIEELAEEIARRDA